MLPCTYACRSADHTVSRRTFLGTTLGTTAALGLAGFANPAAAKELSQAQKCVLVVFLEGGLSQLESWDPKPDTRFGGPFRTIPTSVPGVHGCELLKETARQMHRLAVVRSVSTKDNSHSAGVDRIQRGDPKNRGVLYPYFGAAVAKLVGSGDGGLPPYVVIKPGYEDIAGGGNSEIQEVSATPEANKAKKGKKKFLLFGKRAPTASG